MSSPCLAQFFELAVHVPHPAITSDGLLVAILAQPAILNPSNSQLVLAKLLSAYAADR
jgi:hypothetical protein